MIGRTNCGAGGSGGGLPEFTYTGTYMLVDDGDRNWRLKLLTSGIFTPAKNMVIDVFLVSGGQGGFGGYTEYVMGGGYGGSSATHTSVVLTAGAAYAVVIGAGGTGGAPGGNNPGNNYGQTSAFSAAVSGLNAASPTGLPEFGDGSTLYGVKGATGTGTAPGASGTPNTGNGGQGGGKANVSGGAGGSGIVIIRNHREAA